MANKPIAPNNSQKLSAAKLNPAIINALAKANKRSELINCDARLIKPEKNKPPTKRNT